MANELINDFLNNVSRGLLARALRALYSQLKVVLQGMWHAVTRKDNARMLLEVVAQQVSEGVILAGYFKDAAVGLLGVCSDGDLGDSVRENKELPSLGGIHRIPIRLYIRGGKTPAFHRLLFTFRK